MVNPLESQTWLGLLYTGAQYVPLVLLPLTIWVLNRVTKLRDNELAHIHKDIQLIAQKLDDHLIWHLGPGIGIQGIQGKKGPPGERGNKG